MTNASDTSDTKLLNAYRMAVMAEQDGIADELEDVILDRMGSTKEFPLTIHTGTTPKVEPHPWWTNPTTKPNITYETKE